MSVRTPSWLPTVFAPAIDGYWRENIVIARYATDYSSMAVPGSKAISIPLMTLDTPATKTSQTDLAYTANNATVAADASHRVWPSHQTVGNESISTTDTLALTMIDAAVEKAKLATPLIRIARSPFPILRNRQDFMISLGYSLFLGILFRRFLAL